MLKSFRDYLNEEYECSLRTISQNGGISYSEKEEAMPHEIKCAVPLTGSLFVLTSGKFVFEGN